MAGIAAICLVLLTVLVGLLHLASAGPPREAAMGLVRERPEISATLGMPLERLLTIDLNDLAFFDTVQNQFRFLMVIRGPEGYGVARVELFAMSPRDDQVSFRRLGEPWATLPRSIRGETPGPQAQALMHQALGKLQSQQPDEARPLLDALLRLQPMFAGAWYLRAVTNRDLDDREAALRDIRWALELGHPDPASVLLFEQLLPDTARPAERVAAWATFLEHAPNDPVARARHAKARVEDGDVTGGGTVLATACRNGSAEACRCVKELVELGFIEPPPPDWFPSGMGG